MTPQRGLPKHHGRSTRRYKALRKAFKDQCQRTNAPCWLCGQEIDYTAPQGTPDTFNLDHAFPRSLHPELAEDPGNFRAAHENCNQSRGNKTPTGGLGLTSRKW